MFVNSDLCVSKVLGSMNFSNIRAQGAMCNQREQLDIINCTKVGYYTVCWKVDIGVKFKFWNFNI